MSKRTQSSSGTVNSKKTLKQLFEERDRTSPGSKEEEETAQKILESVFPDTEPTDS